MCAGNDAADVMVKVGGMCIDRYEASVWSKPDGGVQYGVDTDDYPCADNGQDCKGKIFARSVAGVKPSSRITWFQAQRALKNSGKQLPSNAQWQQAVAGTPDSTACNVNTGSAHNTGQDAGCVSEDGVNDMVGNLWEWVADWAELADNCTTSPPRTVPISRAWATTARARTILSGALLRGGGFSDDTNAGPFAVYALVQPSIAGGGVGFRGLR